MNTNQIQLSQEVVDEIKQAAKNTLSRASKSLQYSAGYFDGYYAGATAYASKLHQANETIKVLTYDNDRLKGEVEGLTSAVEELKTQTGARCEPDFIEFVKNERNEISKEMLSDEWWLGIPAAKRVKFENVLIAYDQMAERLSKSAAGREDWISVEERPLIKRNDEWWELTKDGEKEFIAAVPYHDAETDDPTKDRWWIRHCYIDSEGYLNVKRDNEMDEDVAGWNVSDITYWRPLPEPPIFKQQKEK